MGADLLIAMLCPRHMEETCSDGSAGRRTVQQAPPGNMDLPEENVVIEKKAFLDFDLGNSDDQDETQTINEKKQIIDAIGGKMAI